jgi:hypothetical protein
VVVGFECRRAREPGRRALSVLGVVQRLNDLVGSTAGAARHGREPPGGHQEPRDLRVPGQPGLILAHRDLEGICLERDLQREKARLEPRYAELDLRRPLVQPPQAGARRLHRREPAVRHRRGAAAPVARVLRGRRAPSPPQPLRLRPGHLRRRGQLPPRGLGRLRRLWGLSVETWAGTQGHLGRAVSDAVARTVRGRPGRRAARLHGEPPLRPAPGADDIAGSRAHVRGLVPRRRARARPSATRSSHALDQVEDRARRGHLRLRRRPTRTSTPPSSGASRELARAGAKLHTGRSRNDQVATDLRLYTKRALLERRRGSSPCSRCCSTGRGRGRRLPAGLHAPAARPAGDRWPTTSWPTDGRSRATSTGCSTPARRADVSPLGAGALAGSSIAARPRRRRRRTSASPPGSRTASTPVATATSWRSPSSPHAGRPSTSPASGEELVLWTSDEFGFARSTMRYAPAAR